MNFRNLVPFKNKAINSIIRLASEGVIANDSYPYVQFQCGAAAIDIYKNLMERNAVLGWSLMLARPSERQIINNGTNYHAWLENNTIAVDLVSHPKALVVLGYKDANYSFARRIGCNQISPVDPISLINYIIGIK